MNPQDPLANLHPLRQPEVISWWPPAPGWWVLLGAVVLLVAVLGYYFRKRRKRNAYRRLALLQLQSLHTQYLATQDLGLYIGQINTLLKSVALRAYPRSEVAATHGEAWRSFLNSSLPAELQLPVTFDDAAYQKSCPRIDAEQVHRAALLWIKRHRVTR
ncbi:MAG: DUF4381 domain-containing protein [Halioglobus sp.]